VTDREYLDELDEDNFAELMAAQDWYEFDSIALEDPGEDDDA